MDFSNKLKSLQDAVNTYIDNCIPIENMPINTILSSMRYSLFAGGKRMRPVLMLGVGEIFNCPIDDLMPYAAGMEMIHTYSLIHDDLPAMDNDDYRRGKLTCHKMYGEAVAILTGDGLLSFAFEHMLNFACKKGDSKYTQAACEIAHASGVLGMVGGQIVDIEYTGKEVSEEIMNFMHNNKTGALITASVKVPAIISEVSKDDLIKLTSYAHDLGLAFQIIDDILDVTGDDKKLGKKTGGDISNKKATYVSMYGIEKSREIAKQLSERAIDEINNYGNKAEFLNQLTLYLLNRDY